MGDRIPVMTSERTSVVLPAPRRVAPAVRVDRARLQRAVGALALVGIVAGSAAVVLAAAQGGSRFLSPVLHRSGPAWMAGPLGGAWPGRPESTAWLQHALLWDLVLMLACYVVALVF